MPRAPRLPVFSSQIPKTRLGELVQRMSRQKVVLLPLPHQVWKVFFPRQIPFQKLPLKVPTFSVLIQTISRRGRGIHSLCNLAMERKKSHLIHGITRQSLVARIYGIGGFGYEILGTPRLSIVREPFCRIWCDTFVKVASPC